MGRYEIYAWHNNLDEYLGDADSTHNFLWCAKIVLSVLESFRKRNGFTTWHYRMYDAKESKWMTS